MARTLREQTGRATDGAFLPSVNDIKTAKKMKKIEQALPCNLCDYVG
jgi:hypothetical protein